MGFEQIAWFPLCIGLTAAGLVLSFLAFRRRGAASGLRMLAWALLPLAAYLTDALRAIWTIGSTAVGFVANLVFNPVVWSGVAVAGLSVVLFVVSGVLRGRKLRKAESGAPAAAEAPAKPSAKPSAQAPAAGRPQAAAKPAVENKKASKGDDDFSDIEDLLRRRGIS
ncbi:cellulose synthase [Nonomuraea ferruginea]|uniref:Cellulose synthase n=1 Tax=Nonomuraea ferruginea TaxID=46174 RepID=A0ABT4T6A3_9ACTN|nr:cellulose synthase [Nonomuraea ferruginea]MDA0645024.1 cellulose synthase [Nonomuraea ferruginea]